MIRVLDFEATESMLITMGNNEFWDSYRLEELQGVLLKSQDSLGLSSEQLRDSKLVGEAIESFVKKSKRILYYGIASLLVLILIHYVFLRFATGDTMWLFGFLGILGLAGFLIPIWLGTKIIKTKKILRILNRNWRYRLVAGAAISALFPMMPIYVLGSEYARTLSYQIGTCLQLTGADEDYYYVTNVSCYSSKALNRIVDKVDSAQMCESRKLTSFETSLGLYCLEQIRATTPEELEIIGDREISDESSF
jgi:hypothetical protein